MLTHATISPLRFNRVRQRRCETLQSMATDVWLVPNHQRVASAVVDRSDDIGAKDQKLGGSSQDSHSEAKLACSGSVATSCAQGTYLSPLIPLSQWTSGGPERRDNSSSGA